MSASNNKHVGERILHAVLYEVCAMVMLVPGSDLGIVVLTNMDGTPTRDLIPRHALDRLCTLAPELVLDRQEVAR